MTIEILLGMTADELDQLTEQQKMEYFSKYFPITRPEMQVTPVETKGKRIVVAEQASSKKAQANAILQQFGFKLKI